VKHLGFSLVVSRGALGGTWIEEITVLDSFGQLHVSGDLNLSGPLDLELLNGYMPDLGDISFIATARNDLGSFGRIDGLRINGDEEFQVIYNQNNELAW
jgi:hypothetical protein